jgi:hypothetical protein
MAKSKQVVSSSPSTQDSANPEETRRRYNKAVREARLITITLSSLKFEVARNVEPKEDNRKLSYHHSVSELVIQPVEEGSALFARVEWHVDIRHGRKKYSWCSARYDVIYDMFSDIDDEIAELFAENVAQPATYAYFRALYANLDWSAGLRSPPLPIIKFFPKT